MASFRPVARPVEQREPVGSRRQRPLPAFEEVVVEFLNADFGGHNYGFLLLYKTAAVAEQAFQILNNAPSLKEVASIRYSPETAWVRIEPMRKSFLNQTLTALMDLSQGEAQKGRLGVKSRLLATAALL